MVYASWMASTKLCEQKGSIEQWWSIYIKGVDILTGHSSFLRKSNFILFLPRDAFNCREICRL